MTLEEINKWLDNEYGVSYTKLEELHDFYFEKYCDLKKENQELKLELSGYRQAILEDKDMLGLKEENEELKKQLTTYKILHRDCKVDNLKNISKIEEMENQQKEVIEYLEDEIKQINPKELDIGELNLRLDDIKFTQYLIYKEILQKYKEIIGVSNEY